jgi:XTP/dITP diphosphohydrolase
MKLLVATTNQGKIVEIEHEFRHAGLLDHPAVIGLKDLPAGWVDCVEDRPTFVGNAVKKARYFAQISGALTLADDSGLCVDALHGAPGVLSARYAGEPCDNAANNAKLLAALQDVPDDRRQASFVCAMALCSPTADLAVFVDEVHGQIIHQPRGANGFGYDPLFFFPQFGKTTAELDMQTKGAISHRGKALRKMIAWLQSERAHLLS